MRHLILVILVLSLAGCGDGQQEAPAEGAEASTPASGDQEGAVVTHDPPEFAEPLSSLSSGVVIVPSPAEVFLALSYVGPVRWSDLGSFNRRDNYASDGLRAVNLGTRAADAFLAIQDSDAATFRAISGVLFTLGQELGVGSQLVDRGSELVQMADAGRWVELRATLDSVQLEIEREVEEVNDPELVTLVGVGAWVEGLTAVSRHLTENYSDEASTILYQPALADHYIERVSAMPAELRNQVAPDLGDRLQRIRDLIDVGGPGIAVSPEAVEEIHQIGTELVATFEGA